MDPLVVVAVLVATLFADMIVEVSAEITTDVVLEHDVGAIGETIPEPRSAVVDMMPDAAAVWWTMPVQ
jgi:hypothetical protein